MDTEHHGTEKKREGKGH